MIILADNLSTLHILIAGLINYYFMVIFQFNLFLRLFQFDLDCFIAGLHLFNFNHFTLY